MLTTPPPRPPALPSPTSPLTAGGRTLALLLSTTANPLAPRPQTALKTDTAAKLLSHTAGPRGPPRLLLNAAWPRAEPPQMLSSPLLWPVPSPACLTRPRSSTRVVSPEMDSSLFHTLTCCLPWTPFAIATHHPGFSSHCRARRRTTAVLTGIKPPHVLVSLVTNGSPSPQLREAVPTAPTLESQVTTLTTASVTSVLRRLLE